MESIVLTVAARVLLPLLAIFAFHMLLTGHEHPGGGFAAALVIAAAVSIYLFGNARAAERELQVAAPRRVFVLGLLTAALSGVPGLLAGEPYLTVVALRWEPRVLGGLPLDTALLFDLGVALVAAGALGGLLLTLEEHSAWRS